MAGQKSAMIFDFSRLVQELRPRAFLFENVPNLRAMCVDGFNELIKRLTAAGYSLTYGSLAACDFGSPTTRRRLFVVGFANCNAETSFVFPRPTHGSKNQGDLFDAKCTLKLNITVGSVLAGLPDVKTSEAKAFLNHTGRHHRPETIKHMMTVAPGTSIAKSFRYRPALNGLSRSLTAGVDHSTKSYLHPVFHREMSVREYARLHGFPDTWDFAGTHHNGIKQVANAVPIPLGKAIAASIIECLLK
jgi:DNA (cytosine-5)-methyltransferase 1